MFPRLSLRRNTALLLCMATPLFAAPNWELAFGQGVAGIDDGRYQEALPQLNAALELGREFQPERSSPHEEQCIRSHWPPDTGRTGVSRSNSILRRVPRLMPRAIRLAPLLGYFLQGIGQLRFKQGRWKEAETLLRQAMAECTFYGA